MTIFRKEALRHRGEHWQGKAVILAGIPRWFTALFTTLFFTLALLLLFFGNGYRKVKVSGELISEPRPVTVYSLHQGVISQSFIAPGSQIRLGEALYEIDVGRTTAAGAVNKIQKQNIEQQIAMLDNILERTRHNKEVTLALIARQKASYQREITDSQPILDSIRKGMNYTRHSVQSYQEYLRRGLINKEQLTDQVSLDQQQQLNMLNVRTQHQQNKLQILLLASTLQTQAAEFDNQLFQLAIQRSDLVRQLTEAEASGSLRVTAPVTGRIETSGIIPGQTISPGDSLLQIIPGNISHYQLVLWVPAHAVPYVAVGDRVNLSYDAFPAEKFGQFSGEVVAISAVPASRQEMATYPSAQEMANDGSQTWYKMRVIPRHTRFSWRNRRFQPQNGLRASCTLFLEKRRLIEWLFSPVLRIGNETRGPVDAL